jgi:hypothetical protein
MSDRLAIRNGRAGAFVLTFALVMLGCDSGPERFPVTGAVTWHGEPVERGDIIFESEDPNALPEAGKVVNGRYEMKLTAGRKKVRLYASKEKPVPNNAMGQGEREVIIPPDYNALSTITREVSPAGRNEFDFHLPR